jgi:hypothetical protein
MRIKKAAAFLAFFLAIVGLAFLVSGLTTESVARFEVDVVGSSQETIGLDVPDYIYFGNVSDRETIRTMMGDLKLNNTGNVPINVSVELLPGNDEVFNYLYLSTYAERNYTHYSNFQVSIPVSGKKNIYAMINLTDYGGNIPFGVTRMHADVKFIATS